MREVPVLAIQVGVAGKGALFPALVERGVALVSACIFLLGRETGWEHIDVQQLIEVMGLFFRFCLVVGLDAPVLRRI